MKINTILLITILISSISCERSLTNTGITNYPISGSFNLGDTIEVGIHDCLGTPDNLYAICFDSVLYDSRCPEDVICIWQGEAIVRFKLHLALLGNQSIDIKAYAKDTINNMYEVNFVDLLPYPNTTKELQREDYKAYLCIKKIE